jgi:large subunit ribosomal protein L33
MAAKKQTVEIIALQCTECKRRNYTTKKNRKTMQEKLEMMSTASGIASTPSTRRLR